MKKHIFITGRVQGVGFRHFTRKNAENLGVTGWVKNLSDGRVEAVFQGSEEQIEELIQRCKKGPVASYVQNIEVEKDSGEEDYKNFSVEF
ncbi:MAG: acylphosphatase [Gracilimonas sp.]|uniref:acylphosphatase n=1 Tax=Gracilimonas sp. TaxID=1974203 RepID=UPI003752F369|nr:acylphosphatase [Gracilimonas sp.]